MNHPQLEQLLSQCRAKAFTAPEIAEVSAQYAKHQNDYLDRHMTSRMTSSAAIACKVAADDYALANTQRYINKIVDDFHKQGDGHL